MEYLPEPGQTWIYLGCSKVIYSVYTTNAVEFILNGRSVYVEFMDGSRANVKDISFGPARPTAKDLVTSQRRASAHY